ncbi:hypothetical protein TSUD_105420 [Trifolium subterraneum]|uniref:Bulb-type lectin domain-containing protein n=1 Tax=Trifolium subterraneum TaxID=3900 RepID=A0A2Z6LIL3_TRISU|nr:hypothetical protein TSUD_105420 [Trifolium subterraneum]
MSFPKSVSVVSMLLDTGNLVLRNRPNDDASNPLWQSIDHPTDTWLPGGKIKLDTKTKKPQYLTSWKNKKDPATGLFSLELDPKGTTSYLILWNKSEQYWTSGPWNGHIFSLVPEMRANYIYNFSFVSNENESYFTYSLYNPSIITRFVMDISGQIKQLSWLEGINEWNLFWSQPRTQCVVYAFCGAFGSCTENSKPYCNCLSGFEPKSQSDWDLEDHSGGCKRKTTLQCESSDHSNGVKDRPDDDALDPLWESSNHPTDTLLPGGKTKLENKTKKPRYLTSWKNRKDPATGYFSLELNPKEHLRIFFGISLSSIGQVNFGINKLSSDPKTQVEVYAFCGAFGSYNEYGSYKNRNGYCNCLSVLSQSRSLIGILGITQMASKAVIEGGSVITLLDPRLEGNADIEEVAQIIKVASWCVQDNETERPTMGQVVQILEGILEVNLPPIPRSLQMFVDNHDNVVLYTDSSSTQSLQVKSNISTISPAKSNISSASSKSSTEN